MSSYPKPTIQSHQVSIEPPYTKKPFIYQTPSTNDCVQCHYSKTHRLKPIGFNATSILLNASTLPLSLKDKLNNWQTSKLQPRKKTLRRDYKARAYLHSNCAHCHSAQGIASNTGLYLDLFEDNPIRLGICKQPVSAGNTDFSYLWNITPGKPSSSFLPHRMNTNEPSLKMPEIGQATIHHEGVQLISDWIQRMDAKPCLSSTSPWDAP